MNNRQARGLALTVAVVLGSAATAPAQDSGSSGHGTTLASDGCQWPFRVVVVPDSQRYTIDRIYASDPRKEGDTRKKLPVAERAKIWELMMKWVADNAKEQNIRLLLHVGDIVEHKRERAEHEIISKGLAHLDGNVPYVLALGNHDGAPLASEFFPVSRNPLNEKIFGGARSKGSIADLYARITINGQKYLILTLGYGSFGSRNNPRENTPSLEWANKVVRDHTDHKVIFVTHSLLGESRSPGGTPSFSGSGRYLLDNFLTKHKNMYMTFCGHVYDRTGDGVATGYRKDVGEAGNPIHSTLFNAQWIDTNGGDGWLRIVEFHKDGKIVQRTYSPYLKQWNTAPGFQFEIPPEKSAK